MKKILITFFAIVLNCSFAFATTLDFDDLAQIGYGDSFKYEKVTFKTFPGSHLEITNQTADGFGNAHSLGSKLSVWGEQPWTAEKSKILMRFDHPVEQVSFWLSGTFHNMTINGYDSTGNIVVTQVQTYPIPSNDPVAPDGQAWDYYYDRVLRLVTIEASEISEVLIQPSAYDGFSIDDVSYIPACIKVGGSPFANAGLDIYSSANSLITLNGNNSFDENGILIEYQWLRLPEKIVLCDSAVPTCNVRSLGRAEEVVELRVFDNDGNCSSDLISIKNDESITCGNGVIEGNEVCDSNFESCILNNGYVGTKTCNAQCSGFGNCVTNEFCGDGIKNGIEACDNGSQNGQPNKCNAQCSGITTSVCGNSVLETSEQCDDGNTNSGDGCSNVCTNESAKAYIWIEAEAANSLVSPMQIANDTSASQGKFVYTPNGSGSSTTPNATLATYTVNITQAGNYIIWGRVIASSSLSDSFFVKVDSGADNYWAVERGSLWLWDKVNNNTGPDPVVYNLIAGSHTIKVIKRDDGTKLDKLLLTNNLTYTPSGAGE